ncbi:MAG: MFS transporter [Burkholderiales bacterium]|nr:MFS transporter [Burkholderiales bacterium]
MIQLGQVAARRKLPLPVVMFAVVSLLNEVSAQMVAPLIPILLVSVLAAGPVAIGAVEGIADAAAAFLKLWSGRHADVRPQRRKAMVFVGYGLALASRPLIGLAGNWGTVIALRAADRLGKGLRGAPRDAILADATPKDMQGRAYGLNRGMDYAGAVLGSLIAAGVLGWWGIGIPQVILLSALPGLAVLALLALLPNPATAEQIDSAHNAEREPLRWSALSPALRGYLQVLALFCFAKASEAFIMLRGHELGLSTVTLLLLWAWLAALQSVVALAGAPATDRMSKRRLTLLNWTFLAIGYAALAWASTGAGLWIAVSIYGVLSGISEGVERSLVSELADTSGKGTAFGWYHMVTGLAAIPAGLLFGLAWKLVGPAGAFAMTALIALACALWLKLSLRGSAVPSRTLG